MILFPIAATLPSLRASPTSCVLLKMSCKGINKPPEGGDYMPFPCIFYGQWGRMFA